MDINSDIQIMFDSDGEEDQSSAKRVKLEPTDADSKKTERGSCDARQRDENRDEFRLRGNLEMVIL